MSDENEFDELMETYKANAQRLFGDAQDDSAVRARQMLKDKLPAAAAALITILETSSNERLRSETAKYLIDRFGLEGKSTKDDLAAAMGKFFNVEEEDAPPVVADGTRESKGVEDDTPPPPGVAPPFSE